jgi:hypothetical protein
VRPAGSAPAVTLKVNVPGPPFAVNDWLNADPACVVGSEPGDRVSVATEPTVAEYTVLPDRGTPLVA